MARQRRYEVGVGLLLVVAVLATGWMALRVGAVQGFGRSVKVDVRLADAAGIGVGAAVAVSGVTVGSVDQMRLDHDVAIARLSLSPDVQPRVDARLRIRARSILGEKYLELHPGSRDAAPLGPDDVLELADDQIELDELVAALGPIVAAIDGEAIAEMIAAVAEVFREDPERVGRMIRRADELFDDARGFASRLDGLADRVETTLTRADRALTTFDARARELKSPVQRADALLAEAQPAVRDLPGLTQDARDALADLRRLVGRLDGDDSDLVRVLSNLAEIDKWELRRLLREEGILIRTRARDVIPGDEQGGR